MSDASPDAVLRLDGDSSRSDSRTDGSGGNALTTSIGQRLRSARRSRGMTLDHVARLTGVHKTYLSKIEQGRRHVSVKTLFRLCQVLDTDMTAVTDGIQVISSRAFEGTAPLELQSLSDPQEGRIQMVRAQMMPRWLCLFPAAEAGSATTFVAIKGTCEVSTARAFHRLKGGDRVTVTPRAPFTWTTTEGASSCVITATPTSGRLAACLRNSATLEPAEPSEVSVQVSAQLRPG